MRPSLQKIRCALLFVVLAASNAPAQLVNIRTAPVSVPQQFFTFPARYLGMGGSLALNDLEADPFSNPATAARIRGGLATISPSLYHVGDDQGFGRALPITVMGGGPAAFGVLSLAPQELETTPRNAQFWRTASPDLRVQRFAHNFYTYAAMGQRFDQSRSAVALGISYADLNRVHMVDLLYPDARLIDQGGYLADVRLGYTKELQNASSIEATLVRNHVDMEHTVTYIDNSWNPTLRRMVTALPRVEYNADRTTTWGAQFGFKGPNPVGQGWRLAGSFTANGKTHPKIPNYNFMRIPKDPGNSWAFQLDGGAAWVDSLTTLTFDVSYMPIWTSTWAEAGTGVTSASGKPIPVGAPTIENEFVFSNINLHFGWLHRFGNVEGQAGLNALHIGYSLEQYDHIRERARSSNEGWTEWSLFWGLNAKVGAVALRYFGSHQGALDIHWGERRTFIANVPATANGPDVVAAPSASLSNTMAMAPTKVTSHQFMLSIPFGRR